MITNIGALLKRERTQKGISLEEVEKATKIRKKNLIAIESEDWSVFPSRTYIQGIIKRYGSYLELDQEKLAAYFRREYEKHESLKFKQKAVKNEFTPFKKRLVHLTVFFLVIIFSSFFGYQVYLFLKPPEVIITAPSQDSFKRTDRITLQGTAPKESIITVNGKEVFLDDNQIFETDIALTERRNVVVIEAIGANGKRTIIEKVFTKEE